VVRRGAAALIDLSKQNFRGARAALEVLGSDAPDRLARDELLRLVASVGDFTELAPGLTRPFELVSVNVPLVAAQIGYLKITSRVGFFVHRITNRSTLQCSIVTSPPAGLYAQSTATGSVTRGFQANPSASLAFETGTTLTAITSGFNLLQSETYQPNSPLWVPPGLPLEVSLATVNTAMDILLALSEPIA
jgi:hypothetical protein